jgi:adenylate kinase
MNRARSLHIEHVSPAGLMQRGISRRSGPSGADEASVLALLRRWFFARKPDAGFVLTDFPATLLQAKVFDEWLDARGEEIDAAVARSGAPGSVVGHYRTLGLLHEGAGAPL